MVTFDPTLPILQRSGEPFNTQAGVKTIPATDDTPETYEEILVPASFKVLLVPMFDSMPCVSNMEAHRAGKLATKLDDAEGWTEFDQADVKLLLKAIATIQPTIVRAKMLDTLVVAGVVLPVDQFQEEECLA